MAGARILEQKITNRQKNNGKQKSTFSEKLGRHFVRRNVPDHAIFPTVSVSKEVKGSKAKRKIQVSENKKCPVKECEVERHTHRTSFFLRKAWVFDKLSRAL